MGSYPMTGRGQNVPADLDYPFALDLGELVPGHRVVARGVRLDGAALTLYFECCRECDAAGHTLDPTVTEDLSFACRYCPCGPVDDGVHCPFRADGTRCDGSRCGPDCAEPDRGELAGGARGGGSREDGREGRGTPRPGEAATAGTGSPGGPARASPDRLAGAAEAAAASTGIRAAAPGRAEPAPDPDHPGWDQPRSDYPDYSDYVVLVSPWDPSGGGGAGMESCRSSFPPPLNPRAGVRFDLRPVRGTGRAGGLLCLDLGTGAAAYLPGLHLADPGPPELNPPHLEPPQPALSHPTLPGGDRRSRPSATRPQSAPRKAAQESARRISPAE